MMTWKNDCKLVKIQYVDPLIDLLHHSGQTFCFSKLLVHVKCLPIFVKKICSKMAVLVFGLWMYNNEYIFF